MSQVESALRLEDKDDAIMMIDEYLTVRLEKGENLTLEEKNVFYVNAVEREITVGGFGYLFTNTLGGELNDALKALRLVGAKKTARLVEKAIDVFPDSLVPIDDAERDTILDEIEESASKVWADLDADFEEHEENITEIVLSYIVRHRESFH